MVGTVMWRANPIFLLLDSDTCCTASAFARFAQVEQHAVSILYSIYVVVSFLRKIVGHFSQDRQCPPLQLRRSTNRGTPFKFSLARPMRCFSVRQSRTGKYKKTM